MWFGGKKKTELQFELVIVIEPDDGEFYAYCPALKGLHVGGKTEQEALENAKDAAIAYLASLVKHGDPIPVGTKVPEERRNIPYYYWSPNYEHVERFALTV